MSGKRNYWSKMDHSEARNATALMRDDEAGRWLRGWLAGAAGEDAADSAPMEWRMGFSAGKASLQDAEAFSRKQSERVSARYTKATAVDPVEEKLPDDTEATSEYHLGLPELPINKQTNKQTNKEQRARRAAFSPSAFDHMIPESLSTFADFVESWHGWMSSRHDRKKPISEAAAKTQLEDLAGFGRVGAVLSIRQSIAHDWQGLFAPKTQGVQSQPVRAPATPATQPTLKPAWVE